MQIFRVRVPIPIVIVLILIVPIGVWWKGTVGRDFLKEPSPERLERVRQEVRHHLQSQLHAEAGPFAPPEVVVVQPEPEKEAPKEPEIPLGNLTNSPGLEAYAVESPKGAAYLVKLAMVLEQRGAFQRSLLAWERVIDLGKADAETTQQAIAAVKRLRPTLPAWNIDPEGAVPLVLHAGTGPTAAPMLEPLLREVADLLGTASAGVVSVTVDLAVGKKAADGDGPAPVALWITGAAKDSPSSEVLSFTVQKPEAVRDQLLRTVYRLVSMQIAAKTAYTAPLTLQPTDDPLEAVSYRITRLCWREFASGLNLPPKVEPVATPPAEAPRAPRSGRLRGR